uniref:START domain-containing protein n=1 Tax=Mucochytrium quahogii TaxID=96639 RepID=A0A7S2S5N3_9STRA|mmetsp:Transcript_7654/g.12393  ORF Transcript_7654/g.12393 Transcript_7654/m.12393 type:complete len:784 (+) Transcript_7654:41-2392(+)|eukprot:CAMPEP_0203751694 /NCGR_PEP_ID=MMETSP0098-20131031/5727_1 /ASSEMBLY_ACC=CAM_ASM_000208 /TAXON_ID=96639 /ORGANISM=" , Strain NY0313808BC1" /LENGTH=783 /DNA_ID=CAMNT_0050641545 /DNA_START=24 /DNA_END=2375 /DNA_ORIENTATION=+
MASEFEGTWKVDLANSDSIEPMLKAMGVGWKIRKIVTMLKVLQKIQVNGDEFIVKNVSKHGEDSTTHLMNAGSRVIKTNRGDKVIDNCTWNSKMEFPLKIEAILPNNKGATEDHRKVLEGGNKFLQKLIYKFPTSSGSEDIVMKRVFVRVNEETGNPVEEMIEKPPVADVVLENGSVLVHRHPSGHVVEPKKAVRAPVSAVHSSISQSSDPDKAPKSLDLWVVCVMSMVWCTLLFNAKKTGVLSRRHTLAASVVAVSIFFLSRVYAKTKFGVRVAKSEQFRWALVVLALMGCTFVNFAVLGQADLEENTTAGALFVAISGCGYIMARVNTGLMAACADSPLTALRELDPKVEWAITVISILLSSVSYNYFGLWSPFTALFAFCALFSRFAMWYNTNLGFDRFTQEESTDKSQGTKTCTDKEGKTLTVKVSGHRIFDDAYAQYKVDVSYEGESWSVWRRFSQFDTLRHELRRMFGHGRLPQVPSKTWFSHLDEDFLDERTLELDEFMQALMDSSLRKQVFKIAETQKFLGIGQKRGRSASQVDKAEASVPTATAAQTDELCKLLKKAYDTFSDAASVGEGRGWTFLKKHHDVQCYLKTENGLTHTKGVGEITYSPLVVAAFLADPTKRKQYDDLFKRATPICGVDCQAVSKALEQPVDFCDVKHVEFKSPYAMAVSPRDCVLISCRIVNKDGTVTVIMASAPDSYSPPNSKYVRAQVIAAGLRFAPNPAKPGTTLMTNVQMMDPNGNIPGWIVKAVAPERCILSKRLEEALGKMKTPPAPLSVG